MYICVICNGVNHDSCIHCHYCGTVPAKYSWIGQPMNDGCKPVVVAHGAVRAAQHHLARFALRTVAADYYAEA